MSLQLKTIVSTSIHPMIHVLSRLQLKHVPFLRIMNAERPCGKRDRVRVSELTALVSRPTQSLCQINGLRPFCERVPATVSEEGNVC
jgi:hypothetical protein